MIEISVQVSLPPARGFLFVARRSRLKCFLTTEDTESTEGCGGFISPPSHVLNVPNHRANSMFATPHFQSHASPRSKPPVQLNLQGIFLWQIARRAYISIENVSARPLRRHNNKHINGENRNPEKNPIKNHQIPSSKISSKIIIKTQKSSKTKKTEKNML